MNKNYILTLDFIKKHCEELLAELNSDDKVTAYRARTAIEVLVSIEGIEQKLKEIL